MIPRWFRPSFWRAEAARVESMADPADRSWDEAVVECDRCPKASSEWVAVTWQERLGGRVRIVNEDLIAALCPECARRRQAEVRRAVARVVRRDA